MHQNGYGAVHGRNDQYSNKQNIPHAPVETETSQSTACSFRWYSLSRAQCTSLILLALMTGALLVFVLDEKSPASRHIGAKISRVRTSLIGKQKNVFSKTRLTNATMPAQNLPALAEWTDDKNYGNYAEELKDASKFLSVEVTRGVIQVSCSDSVSWGR